ncbi:MAG TPA: PD-(D/E)XK nuclease-like domain-containing protein [Afipia sp.]
MIITQPRVYRDFPTAAYFADPCPEPSFSQSLAKILLEQSPLHAKRAHPRLTPPSPADDEADGYNKVLAIGNAAHALMLNRGKELAVGDFKDWRTTEAKGFRFEASRTGKEPILRKHFDVAGRMIDAAMAQLTRVHGTQNAFTHGDAEVVIANCENGIWLRSMLDWITPDLREVWDYKSGGVSASPYATPRRMADAGWHIQAAFHERILDAIDPKGAGRRKFFYVAQENEEPFALTVNVIGEAALTIGRKQVDYAVKSWRHCLTKGVWPGYPSKINVAELPGWAENNWLSREVAESGNDPSLIYAG